jgi:hypothetical protein
LGKHYRHHHRCAFVLDGRRMRMAANESVSAESPPIHACELRVDRCSIPANFMASRMVVWLRIVVVTHGKLLPTGGIGGFARLRQRVFVLQQPFTD